MLHLSKVYSQTILCVYGYIFGRGTQTGMGGNRSAVKIMVIFWGRRRGNGMGKVPSTVTVNLFKKQI